MKFLKRLIPVLFISLLMSNAACSQSGDTITDPGKKLMKEENYRAALEYFDKKVKEDEHNYDALLNRGACYRWIGELDKAMQDIDMVIRNDPKTIDAYIEKAAILFLKRNFDQALKQLSKALLIDSTSTYAYIVRSAVYFEINEFDKAIDDCNHVLKTQPNNVAANYNLGLCYRWNYRYEDAAWHFSISLKERKFEHLAFYERGICAYYLENYTDALNDFQKAIDLNNKQVPYEKIDNGRTYYYKGLSNYYLKNYSAACADFDMAISLHYQDAVFTKNILLKKLNCDSTVAPELTLMKTKSAILINDSIMAVNLKNIPVWNDSATIAKENLLITKIEDQSKITCFDSLQQSKPSIVLLCPNPWIERTTFKITKKADEPVTLEVIDLIGRKIINEQFSTNTYILARGNLKRGVYSYAIYINKEPVFSGKFIID